MGLGLDLTKKKKKKSTKVVFDDETVVGTSTTIQIARRHDPTHALTPTQAASDAAEAAAAPAGAEELDLDLGRMS